MPVVFTQSSNYAKEMRKWEPYPTEFGKGERPFEYHEFPKRLYKAEHVSGKGIQIVDAQTAADENEERNLKSRGFHFGPDVAFEAARKEQTEHGRLAAEREYQIQHNRVSERAVAEVRKAEEAHGATHMPDVPETPIKKRGRRPKATVTA